MASLVLDASAAVRIIEWAEGSVPFQGAVLKADLVLTPELVDVIEHDRHLQTEARALAHRERAALLTADQRLQQLAARVLP